MTVTVQRRRWSLLRRARTTAAARADHTAAALAAIDHPPREAARITLPMLSAVADRVRRLCEEPSTDEALRVELSVTLRELEEVIQSAWNRAVTEPAAAPTTLEGGVVS